MLPEYAEPTPPSPPQDRQLALPQPPPLVADPSTRAGELASEHDAQVVRRMKAVADGIEWENEARKTFAKRTFWTSVVWLGVVAAIVLLAGFKPAGFALDPKVLLLLIGTTTINVIAWFAAVTRYLFPKDGRPLGREPVDLLSATRPEASRVAKEPTPGRARAKKS